MNREPRPRLAERLKTLSMPTSLRQKRSERVDPAMNFESAHDLHEALTITIKDNID
jgi:hypothetical protein